MSTPEVRWRQAALAGAGAFVVSYAVLRMYSSAGNTLPHNSWWALGVIALMAAMTGYGGWQIRSYLRGTSTVMPTPQRARRTLVAGQACAIGGAVIAGWYAGHAGIAARRLDVESGQQAFILAVVLTLGAVGLSVVGFVVQGWCRIPEDDDEERAKKNPQGPAAA